MRTGVYPFCEVQSLRKAPGVPLASAAADGPVEESSDAFAGDTVHRAEVTEQLLGLTINELDDEFVDVKELFHMLVSMNHSFKFFAVFNAQNDDTGHGEGDASSLSHGDNGLSSTKFRDSLPDNARTRGRPSVLFKFM
jgi:hypothetical protein